MAFQIGAIEPTDAIDLTIARANFRTVHAAEICRIGLYLLTKQHGDTVQFSFSLILKLTY